MSHVRPISLSHRTAATAVLLLLNLGCTDLGVPSDELRALADLLLLPQQANAPAPAGTSFWVKNATLTVERLNHPDNFNSLYLELRFPAQSVESLNGAPIGASDSILVTVDPRPGAYGFTLSPSGIEFSAGAAPTATFSFAVYGDASVGTSTSSYASGADFVAALDIWREATVDQWGRSPGSSPSGVDAVAARLERSGRFVLAAPR